MQQICKQNMLSFTKINTLNIIVLPHYTAVYCINIAAYCVVYSSLFALNPELDKQTGPFCTHLFYKYCTCFHTSTAKTAATFSFSRGLLLKKPPLVTIYKFCSVCTALRLNYSVFILQRVDWPNREV